MKEITKFFKISLMIIIVALIIIMIGGYFSLRAEKREEINLIGFWQCDANNSKMAIREKDVSIIRNKSIKIGTYYHSVPDSSLSLTFIEERNNKQTYTYIITSFSRNEISLMDENGRNIICGRKTLNKNMVSNK